MRLIQTLVALSTIIVACGGSALSGQTYADANAVNAALARSGIVCTSYRTPSSPSPPEATAGRCTADNESLRISTFKDAGAEKNAIGELKTLGCAVGQGLGVSSIPIVEGNRWTIKTETETEAKKIADQFGGKAQVVYCD